MTQAVPYSPTALSRWLPHPLVSIIVACTWLMLQHSLSLGNLLLAIVLAMIIPKIMQRFVVCTPNLDWQMAFKLFCVVFYDIIVSNIKVAKLLLGSTQKLKPKWYRVPLETQHNHVNSLLAMIITTTPGTVSAGIDLERGDILVHSLYTEDAQADIDDIKKRYEQPLIQIFHALDTFDRIEQVNEVVSSEHSDIKNGEKQP